DLEVPLEPFPRVVVAGPNVVFTCPAKRLDFFDEVAVRMRTDVLLSCGEQGAVGGRAAHGAVRRILFVGRDDGTTGEEHDGADEQEELSAAGLHALTCKYRIRCTARRALP